MLIAPIDCCFSTSKTVASPHLVDVPLTSQRSGCTAVENNSGGTVAAQERLACVQAAERPGAVAYGSTAQAPCLLPVCSAMMRVARGSAGVLAA